VSAESTIKGYLIVHLEHILDEIGEDETIKILLGFSCPLNSDVEKFLRHKAIEFAKQSLSQTFLVFTSYKDEPTLVGYFTLANKTILVDKAVLRGNVKRKIGRFGTYNPVIKKYVFSAPLIAQIGKNYKYHERNLISGDELLKMACDKIAEAQFVLGGKVVYLECEDNEKLKNFYSSNGFVEFGKRKLDRDEKDDLSGEYLVQMLKYTKKC